MSPNRKTISDIARQLGLRAPVSKKAVDWELKPAVKQLYVEEIDNLSKEFLGNSNIDIRTSQDLRSRSNRLLQIYGPVIWGRYSPTSPGKFTLPRYGSRRWLLQPSENETKGLYPKDLYFEDEEHRIELRELLFRLCVEKAIRYRKDHQRFSSSEPNTQATVDSPGPTSDMGPVHRQYWQCWAGLSADHNNASKLRDAGIALFDYEDHDRVVTGRSFRHIVEVYWRKTNQDPAMYGDETPKTLTYRNALEEPQKMVCARCETEGSDHDAEMVREQIDFCHLNMKRSIWIYPCNLDGKKVFALIRWERVHFDSIRLLTTAQKEAGGYSRYQASSPASWSEVEVKGSNRDASEELVSSGTYGQEEQTVGSEDGGGDATAELLRHAVQSESALPSIIRADSTPHFNEKWTPVNRLQCNKTLRSDTAHSRQDGNDSNVFKQYRRQDSSVGDKRGREDNDGPIRSTKRVQQGGNKGQGVSPPNVQSERSQKFNYRANAPQISVNDDNIEDQIQWQDGHHTRGEHHSVEKQSSPGNNENSRKSTMPTMIPIAELVASKSHSTIDFARPTAIPARSANNHTSGREIARSRSSGRITGWLTLKDDPRRSVIPLNADMTAESVFSAVQRKLQDRLAGKTIKALTAVESNIYMHVDDEFAWEWVLKMAQERFDARPSELTLAVETVEI